MIGKKGVVQRMFDRCFPEVGGIDIDDLLEKDKGLRFAVDALRPDEMPERIMPVSLGLGAGWSCYGYLWVTSQRLFFSGATKSLLAKPKSWFREYFYQHIAAVHFTKGSFFREAKIILCLSDASALGGAVKVVFGSVVENTKLQEFVDYIRDKIADPGGTTGDASSS
jgi:hypothetical protein